MRNPRKNRNFPAFGFELDARFNTKDVRHYVRALGVDTRDPEWVGGNIIPQYHVNPGRAPFTLHMLTGKYAWRWMDLYTPVEEATHIAQTRSLPTEASA